MEPPTAHRRAILPVLAWLFSFGVGCGDSDPGSVEPPMRADVADSLIDEDSRIQNFGPVLSRPGRKLNHVYRLTNSTERDVTILGVINRKPCCGMVDVETALLHPGDHTDVEVTLVIGETFGVVAHEAEILTEPASSGGLVLRTLAEALPALHVEDESSSTRTVYLGADEPRRAEFRVYARGTASEPPVDLDRLELRSTAGAEWVGPKEDGPAEVGLTVEARRFVVPLDAVGSPGKRSAEVVLLDGEQDVYRHVVAWDVVSTIQASPRRVVFRSGPNSVRILIRAGDQRPFRVERVECQVPGIQGWAVDTSAAVAQVIEIQGESPRPEDRDAVVTVHTDHPSQARVDLPIVVLD